MEKVILVTGASKGIGHCIATILLDKGAKVVGVSRSASAIVHPNFFQILSDLAGEGQGVSLVNQAMARFGRLDGVVINAGIIDPIQRVEAIEIAAFKRIMQINVYSGIEIIQSALPELRHRKGSIVLVSSGAATAGYGGWGAYASSKAAMNILAKTLAEEEELVTTVAIRPGIVDTEMQSVIRDTGAGEMKLDMHSKFVKLKQDSALLKPEQPAAAIAELALNPVFSFNGQFVKWDDVTV